MVRGRVRYDAMLSCDLTCHFYALPGADHEPQRLAEPEPLVVSDTVSHSDAGLCVYIWVRLWGDTRCCTNSLVWQH